MRNTGSEGLELESDGLRTGHNSGYQAINLAVLLGVKRIILLGYDMQDKGPEVSHWFGNHSWKEGRSPPYQMFLRSYPSLAKETKKLGIEVINCSMNSKLECFKKEELRNLQL